MWLVTPSTCSLFVVELCVLCFGQQREIGKPVVSSVPVDVVNVITPRNRTMNRRPHCTVKVLATAGGFPIVPTRAERVSVAFKLNVWERIRLGAKWVVSLLEHLEHGLPGHSKRSRNPFETVTV